MKKYCFGIDVGGTTIKAGLFEFADNVLHPGPLGAVEDLYKLLFCHIRCFTKAKIR